MSDFDAGQWLILNQKDCKEVLQTRVDSAALNNQAQQRHGVNYRERECIRFLWLCNTFPQPQYLKTIQIYYLTVSTVRSPGKGWLEFLLRSHMATVKVLSGVAFLPEARGHLPNSQFVDRISFFAAVECMATSSFF